jgi:hypothetical protein
MSSRNCICVSNSIMWPTTLYHHRLFSSLVKFHLKCSGFFWDFPLRVVEWLPVPITLRNDFMRYFHIEISCWNITCDFHFSLRNVSWFLTNKVWKTFQCISYRRPRPAICLWAGCSRNHKVAGIGGWILATILCHLRHVVRECVTITCQLVASLTCSVTVFPFGVPVFPVWSVLSCLGRVLLGENVKPSWYKIF